MGLHMPRPAFLCADCSQLVCFIFTLKTLFIVKYNKCCIFLTLLLLFPKKILTIRSLIHLPFAAMANSLDPDQAKQKSDSSHAR